MKALITGSSSGLGKDLARVLSKKGYDLILVARRKDCLEELKKELETEVEIIAMDISSTFNCMKLFNKIKKQNIDILINNAGVGVYGNFTETKIDHELDLIDLNIKTVHTLTKLFLKKFKEKDEGYILNVSSTAAFTPGGPMMASYYASKSYVLKLTEAIHEELRQECSNVYIGALCPGPINTDFNENMGIKKHSRAMDSYKVAESAVDKMFKRKVVIIPGCSNKILSKVSMLLPSKITLKKIYSIQRRKRK